MLMNTGELRFGAAAIYGIEARLLSHDPSATVVEI